MDYDKLCNTIKLVIKNNLTVETTFTSGSMYSTPKVKVELLLDGEVISTSEHSVYIRGSDLS